MQDRREFTRREFLKRAAAIPAAISFEPWLSRADAASAKALLGTGLSLPCAAGDVGADSAVIWLRGERESLVSAEYGRDAGLKDVRRSESITVRADNDYTAKVFLRGLEPGSIYYYRAVVPDKEPGPIGKFVRPSAKIDILTDKNVLLHKARIDGKN